jgi:hypothetical protein
VLRFRIPEEWLEAPDARVGGKFYRPDRSAVLILNVEVGVVPEGETVTPQTPTELLGKYAADFHEAIVPLGEAAQLVRYDTFVLENWRTMKVRVWRIVQALPPKHVRLVVFALTVPIENADRPDNVADRELFDREIAGCVLLPVLDQTPAWN